MPDDPIKITRSAGSNWPHCFGPAPIDRAVTTPLSEPDAVALDVTKIARGPHSVLESVLPVRGCGCKNNHCSDSSCGCQG